MVKNRNGEESQWRSGHFIRRNESDGSMRVVEAIPSFAQKIVTYICSVHFAGENGPTNGNPDPISATASKEMVSYYKIVIFALKQLRLITSFAITRRSEE